MKPDLKPKTVTDDTSPASQERTAQRESVYQEASSWGKQIIERYVGARDNAAERLKHAENELDSAVKAANKRKDSTTLEQLSSPWFIPFC